MQKPLFRSIPNKNSVLTLVAFGLLSQIGCGGSQAIDKKIAERWTWDGGAEASKLLEQVQKKSGPDRLTAAVGVTGFGVHGLLLSEPKGWSFESPVDVLPTIVENIVLYTGEGTLYALDVADGRLLFQSASGGRRLEGAGFDGEHLILLLVDPDDARQDQIRTMTRSGRDISFFSVNARLGTPAAVDGIGLVPYGGQYVAGFEIESSTWLGRLLYRDALHSVTADDTGVVLWGKGATRFDEDLTSNPESRSLTVAHDEFPGSPVWPTDGSKPRPARAAPINILAHPYVRQGKLRFAQDVYVSTYYQIVMAQEVGTDELLWVNWLPSSIAGATISKTHATLCLDDGQIVNVDLRAGAQSQIGSLETRVKACVVSSADDTLETKPRPPLREQIVQSIINTGPDMAQVQMLLLDRMAELDGEETTVALLKIAQDPMVSSELARHAGNLLSSQTTGGNEMIRALNDFSQRREARMRRASQLTLSAGPPKPIEPSNPDHAEDDQPESQATSDGEGDSWDDDDDSSAQKDDTIDAPAQPSRPSSLRDIRPPPVAAIARALLKLKTEGAAAALSPYLSDPSLSAKDVKTVMNAVFELGGPDEAEQVKKFVLSYKNTGGDTALLDALVQGVEFLLIHLELDQRHEIKAEINESLTHPELKKRARQLKIRRVVEEPSDTESNTSNDDPNDDESAGAVFDSNGNGNGNDDGTHNENDGDDGSSIP